MNNKSFEEIALELAKVEREKKGEKEIIILYEEYVKRVYAAHKDCND